MPFGVRFTLLLTLTFFAAGLSASGQINLTLTPTYGKCTSGPTLACRWNNNSGCYYNSSNYYGDPWACTSDTQGVTMSEMYGCSPSDCWVYVYIDQCTATLTVDNACEKSTSPQYYETRTKLPACGCSC